ncbi:MAG: tetratricopeptide repeat protein [Bythopirellula sp.]
MRKQQIFSWVLSASFGAGSLFSSTACAQFGQLPNQLPGGEYQQKTSWTQKVTGMFTGKPKPIGPNVPKTNPANDPISLGFASGPPNADLYLSMAKMSDQGGNVHHARSMYHRALTMQPENLDGMLALARLEDRQGEFDAALHYYKQAVQNHPQSAKALNDLSLCLARRGQIAEAVAPLEQAVRLQPAKQLYRNNVAKVLIELKQVNGALQHQLAVHPPAVAHYNMGVLLHQRNRHEEARNFLTTATQLDPRLTAAATLMAQLPGGVRQFAQSNASGTPGLSNEHILPTPQTSPYPTTGAASASPALPAVPVPAETARMPVGTSPALLPPVR